MSMPVEEATRRWLVGEQIAWVHLTKCSSNFLRGLLPRLVDASTPFKVTPLPYDQWEVGYNAPVDLESLGWSCPDHAVRATHEEDCPACVEERVSEGISI